MRVQALELTDEERRRLKEIVLKGSDWRERSRAQTILLLAEGLSGRAVAAQQEIIAEVVYERSQRWQAKGFAGLPDGARSGAPRKLSDEHVLQLKVWAEAEALTAPVLLALRIPRQPGHGFHGNLDSDSRPNWTLIPAQSGQPNSMT